MLFVNSNKRLRKKLDLTANLNFKKDFNIKFKLFKI